MLLRSFQQVMMVLTLIACFSITGAQAIEPAWTYATGDRNIGGLVVSPDGSAVVTGAGKVLFLSKNGSVLSNEPYGEMVTQSRDGSSIVTVYSSTVASTVYLFKKKTEAGGNPALQKMWEAQQPNKVVSFAVSDNGDRIACSDGGNEVYILDGNTGNRIGFSENYTSLVAMSGIGTTIAAISRDNSLIMFNAKGDATNKYDISLSGTPKRLFMDTNGTLVVFDAGLNVIAVNVSDGSEIWRRKTSSEVTVLAITPAGEAIVAGTTNGTIDLYDANGNLSWTYYSNSGTGSGQAIKDVAVTRDGSMSISGSVDGKIILLDAAGNPLGIYNTKNDRILRVAIAADGSLAVAAGENTLYAFSAGPQGNLSINPGPSASMQSPVISSRTSAIPSPEIQSTPKIASSTRNPVITYTPTEIVTGYSVIRKATQSPLSGVICISAFMITIFFIFRKNH